VKRCASSCARATLRLAITSERRPLLEQGRDDAARCAAGAEQQDAPAGERARQVDAEVAQQAGAVGVVADNLGAVETQAC
jgi:hypothetical protein